MLLQLRPILCFHSDFSARQVVQEVVPYQATDDDLPVELFESPTEPIMEVE